MQPEHTPSFVLTGVETHFFMRSRIALVLVDIAVGICSLSHALADSVDDVRKKLVEVAQGIPVIIIPKRDAPPLSSQKAEIVYYEESYDPKVVADELVIWNVLSKPVEALAADLSRRGANLDAALGEAAVQIRLRRKNVCIWLISTELGRYIICQPSRPPRQDKLVAITVTVVPLGESTRGFMIVHVKGGEINELDANRIRAMIRFIEAPTQPTDTQDRRRVPIGENKGK